MSEPTVFCAGTNDHIRPAKIVDAILVNVPYNGISDKDIHDTNLMFDHAECEHRFLDTGGYQYAVAENDGKEIVYDTTRPAVCSDTILNLTLEHVIYAMINLDITMANAMDFPIRKRGTPGENEYEYMKKSGFNRPWAIKSLELRDKYCPEVELFLPIQCYDLNQLDDFLGFMGSYQFDGYSIPTRNFKLNELALFLARFYQLGIRKVHILGTSKFFTTALAAYLSRHYFDWVSLDATTWREAAQNGNYLNQHDLETETIYNVIIDERIENTCDCPFCRDKSFTYINNLPQTERINFLRCHNFWVIEQTTKALYENSGSITTLERYLKRKCSDTTSIDDLIRILSLIDMFIGEDIEMLKTLLV